MDSGFNMTHEARFLVLLTGVLWLIYWNAILLFFQGIHGIGSGGNHNLAVLKTSGDLINNFDNTCAILLPWYQKHLSVIEHIHQTWSYPLVETPHKGCFTTGYWDGVITMTPNQSAPFQPNHDRPSILNMTNIRVDATFTQLKQDCRSFQALMPLSCNKVTMGFGVECIPKPLENADSLQCTGVSKPRFCSVKIVAVME